MLFKRRETMKENYFHRVTRHTPTRFWINNVTREEAEIALAEGATGCTQNPSFVNKMLLHPTEKDYAFKHLETVRKECDDTSLVQELLQRELVGEIARRFKPLYDASNGKYGYVSVQGNPFKEDRENIVRNARFNREAGENIMAKVPVTEDGLEAIELLLGEGIPINATEVMCVRQALDVCDIYDRVASRKKNLPPVYFSHIAGIYDEYLAKYVEKNNIAISSEALWQAGIIIAKKIHRLVKERDSRVGFIGGGARGLHHFTEMVGADCCVTINWKGTAEDLVKIDAPVIDRFHGFISDSLLDELLEKVDDFRRAWMINGLAPSEYEEFGPVVLFRESFEKAWEEADSFIGKK